MKSHIHYALSFIVLLVLSPAAVHAEIRKFNGFLEPFSFFIHYSSGYLLTPGSVDLSDLTFSTPFKDGGTKNSTTVDVALFHEPASCSLKGCDWSTLGVGNRNNGGIQWCCTADAIHYGHCSATDVGRLIIDPTVFDGVIRSLTIPGNGVAGNDMHMPDPKMDVSTKSGKYVLIMANCNDLGRQVMVDGSYSFESVHGYLPAELFGEWHFFVIVLCGYIVLASWYGYTMKQYYPESYIEIQKWILATIVLGLAEALFRCFNYLIWNSVGTQHKFFLVLGIAAGVSKHTFARCLLVMVSLGWGVTCAHIADYVMRRIRVLGVFYLTVSTAADVVTFMALVKEQSSFMSTAQEMEWLGAAAILGLLLVAINILYLIWIFAAMTKTMALLANSQQNRKLVRYRQLRSLLLAFSVYAIAWFILMRSEFLYKFLEPTQEWIVAVLMEVDYLIMITGVAILWRPNEHARDFAYDMQLPVGEGDVNELELTEEVIPSAASENGNYQEFATAPTTDVPLPVEDGVTT